MDVPVQNIQALLGDASSDTTMVYYRVSDKRLRATVERLNYAEGD